MWGFITDIDWTATGVFLVTVWQAIKEVRFRKEKKKAKAAAPPPATSTTTRTRATTIPPVPR